MYLLIKHRQPDGFLRWVTPAHFVFGMS
ncbi:putative membrane protein, partial [Vibrio parahaemolyticus V-223/04]